jgi:DNA-directed RNA polymerase subunit RPC12/RpoP
MLKCRGCGGGNAVTPAIRESGWYRCSFCGTANALEPAETSLCEGPASRIVVLKRLSRHHLIVPEGTLLSLGQFLGSCFVAISLVSLFGSAIELEVSTGWRWLLAGLAFLLLKEILQRLYRRHRSEQHIDVSPVRIRCYYRSGEREVEKFNESLKSGALKIAIPEPSYPGQKVQSLLLVAPSGARFKLRLSGEAEAVWAEKLLRQATDSEFKTSEISCRGCGGPLREDLAAHNREYINCPYCSVGLLVARSQTELAPARLPALSPPPTDSPPPFVVDESPDPSRLSLRLLGNRSAGIMLLAISSIAGALMFGSMGLFSFKLVDLTPSGTILLKLWVVCAGIVLLSLASASAFVGLRGWLGQARITIQQHHLLVRDVFALGSGAVEVPLVLMHISDTFGTKYQAPYREDEDTIVAFASDGFFAAYRPEYDLRLPIYLLSELRFIEKSRGLVTMILTAATREFRVTWVLPPESNQWLKERITEFLRKELQDLGRSVEPAPAPVSSQ